MQIESLKIFTDVVRFNSFSKGALENNLTQSSASQMIQQLETNLGVFLIDRSNRPWKVTREGNVFSEGCRELLEKYQNLLNQVKSLNKKNHPVVRIAAIYSVSFRDMNRHIQKFTELFPFSEIVVEYLHPDRVYEKVANEEADIGIVSFPNARRGFLVTPWELEPMVLVCFPTHPLANRDRVHISEIQKESFVGFDRNLVIRKEIDRFLKQCAVSVNVLLEFDNIEAIKRAVESETGISILPLPTLKREVEMGSLKVIPIEGGLLTRPLGMIQRRGKKYHENVFSFMKLLLSKKIG